jgi:hypothetical protein
MERHSLRLSRALLVTAETLQATSLRVLFVVGPVCGIVADVFADGVNYGVAAEKMVVESRLPYELFQSRLVTLARNSCLVGANDGR